MNKKSYVYLDDVRTPVNPEWIVLRDYYAFVSCITRIGLENIHTISLDHDLGSSAMTECWAKVHEHEKLDYDNINEKTGMDCAKWIVNMYNTKSQTEFTFPRILVHSANPVGSLNITSYINNFLKHNKQPQTCVRVNIEHTI